MELINNVAKAHGWFYEILLKNGLLQLLLYLDLNFLFYQVGFPCLLVLGNALVKAMTCTGK